MTVRIAPPLLLLALSACSTTKVVAPPPVELPRLRPAPVVVVVEPFFEEAPVEMTSQAQTVTAWGHSGPPRDVTIVQQVPQKPLYAQVSALAAEQRLVIDEVQRLRPDWRVVSTGELPAVEGPVQLVRVVIRDHEIAGSNRTFKRLSTLVGIVVWPLLLVNLTPVEEVHRVHGLMTLYEARAGELRGRLLRYPTQPDFAVDTRGFSFRTQPFSLDVEFEEGLFAPEDRRPPVLVRGFAERLAVAVVAFVEGIPDNRP